MPYRMSGGVDSKYPHAKPALTATSSSGLTSSKRNSGQISHAPAVSQQPDPLASPRPVSNAPQPLASTLIASFRLHNAHGRNTQDDGDISVPAACCQHPL
jgi:hypothetical protein